MTLSNLGKKRTLFFIVTVVVALISSFLVQSYRTRTALASTNSKPIGITQEGEKNSIARFLLNEFNFNDPDTINENGKATTNTFQKTVLGFNGNNNRVNLSSKPFLPDSSFSIGAFLKLYDNGLNQMIFSQGSNPTYDFNLNIDNENKLNFVLRNSVNNIFTLQQSSGEPLEKNKWYFLSASARYNESVGQTKLSLNIDGNLVGSSVIPGQIYTSLNQNTEFFIGSNLSGLDPNFFHGVLDKAFITQNELTSIQISSWLEKETKSLPSIISTSIFAGLWDFNMQSGNKVQDSSNFQRHGQMENYKISGWFKSDYLGDRIGSYGIAFDGIDDYIDVDISNNVKDQNSGTLDLVFSINKFPLTGKKSTLVSISNLNSSLSYIKLYLSDTKKLYYEVFVNNELIIKAYYDNELVTNHWYHLAITNNTVNDYYLDGKMIDLNYESGSSSLDRWFNDLSVLKITFGAYKSLLNIDDYFSGSIQYIHFYPITFDSQKISKIYNRGSPVKDIHTFKLYPLTSFEVDFNVNEGKLFSGDLTATYAFLKNISIRAPPTDSFSNPSFFGSQGVKFDNSSNYLNLNSQNSVRGFSKFSFGMNFKYESTTPPNTKAYLYKEDYTAKNRFNVFINSEGKIGYEVLDNDKNFQIVSDKIYTDNTWHFVVVTFNSLTKQAKLNIDSTETKYFSFPQETKISDDIPTQIFVGANDNLGSNQFIGSIDSIFIVEDALSEANIKRLNSSVTLLSTTLSNPLKEYVSLYTFNELGSEFIDLGPKQINLSIAAQTNVSRYDDRSYNSGWSNEEYIGESELTIVNNNNLNFDGIDDYISIDTSQSNSSFNFQDNALSLETWIKTSDLDGYILSRDDGSNKSFNLKIMNGRVSFEIYSPSETISILSDLKVSNDSYHHIVSSYDGISASSIYIDGVLDIGATVTPLGSVANPPIPLTIGGSLKESNFLSGQIAGIKIYDISLTAEDVSNIYQSKNASLSNNLRINLELNEGNGPFVYDQLPSRFVGVLNNFSSTSWKNFTPFINLESDNNKIVLSSNTPEFVANKDFTISLWAKPENKSSTEYTLIDKSNGVEIGSTGFIGFRTSLEKTGLNLYKIKSQIGVSSGTSYLITAPLYLPNTVWSNITISYDHAQGSLYIYLNGKEIIPVAKTTASAENTINSLNPLLLGNSILTDSSFKGSISNLQIIDKLITRKELNEIIASSNSDLSTISPDDIIVDLPLNGGINDIECDKLDLSICGQIFGDYSWQEINTSNINGNFKKGFSNALYLNYEEDEYIDFNTLIDANHDLIIKSTFAAKIPEANNDITIFDYGFNDDQNAGALLRLRINDKGGFDVDLSDGNTNGETYQTFSSAPSIVTAGRFINVSLTYGYQTGEINLYSGDTLVLKENPTIELNSEENFNARFMVRGSNEGVLVRSIEFSTGDLTDTRLLENATTYLDIDFSTITGNIAKDYSGLNNDGMIYGNGHYVSIPKAKENSLIDISGDNIQKIADRNILFDGKGTVTKISNELNTNFLDKDFSLEFWLSLDNVDTSFPIFSKGNNFDADSSTNNSLHIYANNGFLKGLIGGETPVIASGIPILNAGTTYHFVLIKDSTNTNNISLYYYNGVNYVKYWNDFQVSNDLNSTSPFLVGYTTYSFGLSNFNPTFIGAIDSIRLLSRPYLATELSSKLVSNQPDDLSMTVDSNAILKTNKIISRFSFNDNFENKIIDSEHESNGSIKADLIRFFNNGLIFEGVNTSGIVSSSGINKQNIELNYNESSIELWLKLDSISKTQTILYKEGQPGKENYSLTFNPLKGFVFKQSSSDSEIILESGTNNITTDTPYYMVITYENTKGVSMYLNGALRSYTLVPQNFSPLVSDQSLYLGHNPENNNDYLRGTMYLLRFWKKKMEFSSVTDHLIDPFTYSGDLNTEDILSEWLFDEESSIISKNTYFSDLDVIISGGQNIWGEKKGTVYLNGIDNYIYFSDNDKYDFNSTEKFTIEAWIKTDGDQNEDFASIISKGDPLPTNNNQGFTLGINKLSSKPEFYMRDTTSGTTKKLSGKTIINDGKLHHIVVTRSITPNQLNLFVDSKLEDYVTNADLNLVNSKKLLIGGLSNDDTNINNQFKGYIDEIRLIDDTITAREILSHYYNGPNEINNIAYNLLVTNNNLENVNGAIVLELKMPPFFELSHDIDIISTPKPQQISQVSNDLLKGLKYQIEYDFSKTSFKPGENISINLFSKLNDNYEKYSLERISDLKIINKNIPLAESFAQVLTVKNNDVNPLNSSETISEGSSSMIQIKQIYNDTIKSKYNILVGQQMQSAIDFKNNLSSKQVLDTNYHSPLSIETPTINSKIRNENEYLRFYKRISPYPNLSLQYIIPSNDQNRRFYSIQPESTDYNLRVQWKLKDTEKSVDGFRWLQDQKNSTTLIPECFDDTTTCLGVSQNASTNNFTSTSTGTSYNSTNRKWKFQGNAESYTLSEGYGDFGTSYYYTYIIPSQGRNKFNLKARDSLNKWGDVRQLELWTDSYPPIATAITSGANPKVQDPSDIINGWWRENVKYNFSVRDDVSKVSDPILDVSGIDYFDYFFYEANQGHDPNVWERIDDNSTGGGGILGRWGFNEAVNTTISDATTQYPGQAHFQNSAFFWDLNKASHFNGSTDYVSFNSDILDLTNDFSVEFWASFDALNDGVVLSKWDDMFNKSYKVTIGADGEIHLFTSSNGYSTIESKSSGANLQINTIYHIVISKEGSIPTFYVNSVKFTSNYSAAPTQYNSNSNFFIGKQDNNNTTYFAGRLYELRVYNKSLIQDQVNKNYAGGQDATVSSYVDNDLTDGLIKTEFDVSLDGSWKVDYKAKDKATPINESGVKTINVKIDKILPSSLALAKPGSDITIGNDDWFIKAAEENKGIVDVSFTVSEGVDSSIIYVGSGLKQMNMVHVINNAPQDSIIINWASSSVLKGLLGFSATTSSGASEYTGDLQINSPLTCTDSITTYPLSITEPVIGTVSVPVWIGGCSFNLTGEELAKMVRNAINTNLLLRNFYDVTYNSTSEKFTIRVLGKKIIRTPDEFTYQNGKYSLLVNLDEDGYAPNQRTTNGKHQILFWAVDNAGNTEDQINDLTFRVDTKIPNCPAIDEVTMLPNAYSFMINKSGAANTYRNDALVAYAKSYYDKTSIPKDYIMKANQRYNSQTPFLMWPKAEDETSNVSDIEGVNYSGKLKYSYLWEKANDIDFDESGNIVATAPNSAGFSSYKSIGVFDPDTSSNTDIINAHRGALIPYQSDTSITDNIPPDPLVNETDSIENDDDGEIYFLWIRVMDDAGNINKCGQLGGDGSGPWYSYHYGTALGFTTEQLLSEATNKYVDLSSDSTQPTKFYAGPFIAGETVTFDKIYFNYTDSNDPLNSATIKNLGEGEYATSQIVYFVNENKDLSTNQPFPLQSENANVDKYPAVQITDSLNPFRTDFSTWNTDYFRLTPEFESTRMSTIMENDFYTGSTNDFIRTGSAVARNNIQWNSTSPPPLKNPSDSDYYTIGRLQNFGIASGIRSPGNIDNILPNNIEVTKGVGLSATTSIYNLTDSSQVNFPLSAFALGDNLEITRGFSNVAGRYKLRIAMNTGNGPQFMQIEFDILPNSPNLDCNVGECSDLKLKPTN